MAFQYEKISRYCEYWTSIRNFILRTYLKLFGYDYTRLPPSKDAVALDDYGFGNHLRLSSSSS
jgi:hypothetical protein